MKSGWSATRWLRAGIDVRTVQQWLGHESLATTQKYLEPSKETEKQSEKMRLPFLMKNEPGRCWLEGLLNSEQGCPLVSIFIRIVGNRAYVRFYAPLVRAGCHGNVTTSRPSQ